MLKKLVLVICGVFVFSVAVPSASFSFYDDEIESDQVKSNEKKEDRENVKNQKKEFFTKLEILVTKYNESDGAGKDAAKADIRKLVAENVENELERKEKKIKREQERVDKIKSDKESHVDKEVKKYISKKGQEKLRKQNAKLTENVDEADVKKGRKSKPKSH
ncbi:MAG: hypothetical protein LBU55_05280 [Elusimicrobiota bacterium]|nr:hypothetical protein [Elusimicrobiota bacterium]